MMNEGHLRRKEYPKQRLGIVREGYGMRECQPVSVTGGCMLLYFCVCSVLCGYIFGIGEREERETEGE